MRRSPLLLAVAVTALSVGCGRAKAPKAQATGFAGPCTQCHGGAADPSGAPPNDLRGSNDPHSVGVGAHTAHVVGGRIRAPIRCEECHPTPQTGDSPAHMDGKVEIAFGALASARGATPTFDASAATCASTYCHGATLDAGGTETTPLWTSATPVGCASCHGSPPPPPHPLATSITQCGLCHGGTVDVAGGIDVAGNLHMNGALDVAFPGGNLGPGSGAGCGSCHGLPPPAPHPQIPGGLETCHTCHAITVDAAGALLPGGAHMNGTIEVVVGAGATGPGCAGCHGAPPPSPHPQVGSDLAGCHLCHATTVAANGTILPGGPHMNGKVDLAIGATPAGGSGCSGCHGAPPPSPHPQVSGGLPSCHLCHAATVTAEGALVPGGAHLNGKVDVVLGATPQGGSGCTQCHGAPPPAPHPQVGTDLPSCHLCHAATVTAEGTLVPGGPHLNGKVDVVLGATGPGGVGCTACHGAPPPAPHPQVAGGLTSCHLCHADTVDASGALLTNGKHLNGQVDVVVAGGGGGGTGCAQCHGAPPPAPHPQIAGGLTTCHLCHADTVDASGNIIAAGGKHIDGQVEVVVAGGGGGGTGCAQCHGAPPPPPHPPARDLPACNFCHAATVDPSGNIITAGGKHIDGQVEVVLGGAGGGASGCSTCHGFPPAAPHPQSPNCVTCHGDNFGNGQHLNGKVDLLPASCSLCHAMPPTSDMHPLHLSRGIFCETCHPGFTTTTIDVALHMNGRVDVQIPAGTWNAAAATCSLSCHAPVTGIPWR